MSTSDAPTSFPKERIRCVLLEGVHPAAAELLQDEGFSVHASARAAEGAELLQLVADAHVLGIRSKTQVTPEVLAAAPRLLAVGCFCIGTNQVSLRAACLRGVPVFNAPFSNTRSVAELTIAEVIALSRRLTDKSASLHAGRWEKSADGAHEVRARTLGIVGYGHIGSQVSVLAEAMGMRVIYYDIAAKLPIGNARPVRTLDELFAQSDVVTLHVPATPATERMIAAPQLEKMKSGSVLINNARGGVVDLPALAEALRRGHLAGAALDVFPVEPAGKGDRFECPLAGLGNVILTPHIAGSTEEAQQAIGLDVAEKLRRFMNNGSTTGAVNVPEVDLPEQPAFEDPTPPAAGAREAANQPLVEPAAEAGATMPPRPARRHHRLLHFHRNVPGVLSQMHARIAALGVNIIGEYLQTNSDVGYVVLDVDPTQGDRVLAGLRAVPETIRVRVLW